MVHVETPGHAQGRAPLILVDRGEKEGTLINSERRIGLVKKVSRAPGQALADFHIFQLIAHYWGCGTMFTRWASPEAAFDLLKEISRGQPCDITGIVDYAHIDAAGGIQWPWADEPRNAECGTRNGDSGSDSKMRNPPRERRLFEDGKFFTPDGKARFFFDLPRPVAEPTDAEFPFVLLTGRGTSAQWHTGSRTDKSDVLRRLAPANCYVEINPADAQRLGIGPGDEVSVSSRRDAIVASAFITAIVLPGQCFIPMHYREVNRLTHAAFDPHSRQPSYKHCAVSVRRCLSHARTHRGTPTSGGGSVGTLTNAARETRAPFRPGILLLRIGHARVHHAAERVPEALRDRPEVAESQVAVIELAVSNPLPDDVRDQLLDLLRGDALEGACGALDGISKADDGGFTGLRFGTSVTEAALADLRQILLVNRCDLAIAPGGLLLVEGFLEKIVNQ